GNFYLGYNFTGTTVGGGAIKNDSGATFDFQSASSVTSNTGTTGFTNAGTLEQTVTTGTTDIAVALTNTGLVSAQTGTLRFDGGGTSSAAGSFAASSGATLDFNTGTYTISGGAFTGAGEMQVSGATVTISAAATFGGLLEVDWGALALGANAATAASFAQTGGAITGTNTLTVSGAATFSGYNWVAQTGTGTTVLAGATTDSSGYFALDGGRVLENKGTFTANATSGGYFSIGYTPFGTSVGGGTIKNDAGATFDFQSATSVSDNYGSASFVNAGTLEQTVTTGTTDIGVAFTNSGAVSVQAGTLRFDGGGTSSAAGSFAVASGATLDFNSGAFTIAAGPFSGAGEVQVSGATVTIAATPTFGGLLEVDSGTLALGANAATAGSFAQTGGTISGTNKLTISGAATFSGYNYDVETGTGTTLLQGATTVSSAYIALDGGRVLENAGTLTVNAASGYGNFYLGYNPNGTTVGGGTIKNDAGATFNFQSASYVYSNTGTTAFINAGALKQTVMTGTTDVAVAFTNTGTVSVQTGTLEFDGGGSSSASAFTVASGATLDFGGGTFAISGGTVNGAGALGVSGGTLALGANAVTAPSLAQTGGTIAGTGTLTVTGAAAFSGGSYDAETGPGTTLLQGATTDTAYDITLDGGRVLENAGTFTVNATGGYGNFNLGFNAYTTYVGGGTIQNDAGATFAFQSASTIYDYPVAGKTTAFVNKGALTQSVTTGVTDIQVAFTNTGTVSVQTGTLEFDGGGTSSASAFTVASGATLDFGGGTFAISGGTFNVAGTVAVSGGTLALGNNLVTAPSFAVQVSGGTLALGANAVTAPSFAQTGGTISGTGTLTVSGAASFTGGNWDTETGAGTTLLQGATTDSAAYIALDGGRVLENAGTFTVNAAGGNFYLGYNPYGTPAGGGSIKNDAGATFTFQSASTIVNNSGTTGFINAGALTQSLTTGTTDIQVAFTNTGAVSVKTGTLEFDGGGTSSASAFTVASGATLDFGGSGTFALSAGTVNGAGTLGVSGGMLALGANAVTAPSLAQTGGTISGTGKLTVTGAATFTGSNNDQETGTGTTLLQGATTDSAAYIALDGGRVLENAGTFTVNAAGGYGNFYLGYNPYGTPVGGGSIKNDAGATFNFQSASYVYNNSGTTAFINAGTLTQSVTTGTTDIQVAFTNTGTVSVQKGTLQFDGGGTSTGGFAVASGATLDFNTGTFTLSGGSIGGAGAVKVTGGALAIGASFTDSAGLNLATSNGAALALNGNILTLAGATNAISGKVTGAGTLKVTGAATLTAVTAGAAGAAVTIDDAGSLTLAGADTVTGALKIEASATATISGTLNAAAAVTFAGAGATLNLSAPASFASTIGGLGFDDTIFLKGITATSATLNASNQLVVANGATTVATLKLSGANTGLAFVTQAATGGTNVIALPKVATVAQYLQVPTLFDLIPGGFSISDTAAAISGGLNALGDAHINAITVSDNGAVGATVAQIASDAAALGKLVNANATPYQLAISDTAANVQAGLPTLQANLAHIASIAASGGPVVVPVATFAADRGALDTIAGGFAIGDTAANLSAALDTLGDANIVSITVSDSLPVGVTMGQLASDAAAIGKLANASATPSMLAVSDTAANVASGLATLEADVAHIASIAASGGPLVVSVATYAADKAALDKIAGGFAVSDTAANLSGAFDSLVDANILGITVSDNGAVGATVGQLTSDATALGKLANASATPFQLAISDTAANVQAGLATLEADAANIASIAASGGPVVVSVATYAADKAALDKIAGGFAILDTAANLSAALDTLGDAGIVAITVSDNGAIGVTVGQLTSDAAAIGKLANAGATPLQLAISDTAANVQAGLATLEAEVANIASIAASGGPVAVSAATYAADKAALDKIAGGFAILDTAANLSAALDTLGDAGVLSITVSDSAPVGLTVGQIASDAATLAKLANASASPWQLAIADTAANVQAALPALLLANGHIASIATTGGTVAVSVATFTADKALLDKIVNGFAVSDTAAHVQASLAALGDADIASITATGGPLVVSGATVSTNKAVLDKIDGGFAVKDTAANISANLAALVDPAVTTITVSDSAAVKATVAQTTSDATAIAKLVNANATPYKLAIADTAANVVAGIASLQAAVAHIGAITATGAVVVPVATFTADKAALDKIVGGFAVKDTAANISPSLAALGGDANAKTITVSDNLAVTVTDAQITNAAAALAKLVNANATPYTLAVKDTLTAIVGDLTALDANTHVVSLTGTSGAATLSAGAIAAQSLSLSGATTALTLAEILAYGGSFSEAAGSTVSIAAGDTLTLTGKTTISGGVSGAGTLALAGGATTIGAGGGLSVANLAVSGTTVTLGESLTYAGAFAAGAGTTLALNGGALTLTGADSFTGAATSGANALNEKGVAAVSGLTIGATTTFNDSGVVNESVASATVGDAVATHVAKLAILAGGVWDLLDGNGIARGAATGSTIANAGLLEKTGGANVSVIAPALTNSGVNTGGASVNGGVYVNSGTLDIQGAVTGGTVAAPATDTISGGATLEFDSSVGVSTALHAQNVVFAGSGALDLTSPQGFWGEISGFAANDSVALLGSWTLSSFAEVGGVGELTLAQGGTKHRFDFAGSFTAGSFAVASSTTGAVTTTTITHT
ncbi:hypothetical protein DFR50_11744, partial [Roseiarcus fermentans]